MRQSRRRSLGCIGAVGNERDPRAGHVAGITAAAGMNGDEIGLRGTVHQSVEQRPIGDGIRAVAHVLGHDVGMRHRAGIEVVARESDRSGQHLLAHHAVDFQAELGAFAMTEPGDARRKPLERDVLARELHPVADDMVIAEAREQQVIDLANIIGIVRRARSSGTGRWRAQTAAAGMPR